MIWLCEAPQQHLFRSKSNSGRELDDKTQEIADFTQCRFICTKELNTDKPSCRRCSYLGMQSESIQRCQLEPQTGPLGVCRHLCNWYDISPNIADHSLSCLPLLLWEAAQHRLIFAILYMLIIDKELELHFN